MTRLKAAAECKALCDKLQEDIHKSFVRIADEEWAYHPGVAAMELHYLRQKLLIARKELEELYGAMRKGDSVVPFKAVA